MSPRRAAAVAEPVAAPVLQCRRCFRPLEDGRTVYCGTACVEAEDRDADRERYWVTALREELEQQRTIVEADIAAYAAERRRHLHDAERHVAEAEAQVAPRLALLAQAKAVGETHWDLQVDRPLLDRSQR